MPRQIRLGLPGVPQHVIQRGNNRQPCFHCEHDLVCYLTQIAQASQKHACRIHAYVLMSNHVHMLMTPAEKGSVAKTMHPLGEVILDISMQPTVAPERFERVATKRV